MPDPDLLSPMDDLDGVKTKFFKYYFFRQELDQIENCLLYSQKEV